MSTMGLRAGIVMLFLPTVTLAQLQVVSTTPALNAVAPVGSNVSVEFDRPLNTATVTADGFRVYGQWSGPVEGTYSFSNGDRTATLTLDHPFSAGELVFVNLSHDLEGADTSPLRAAGYAYQFLTATVPSPATFEVIDTFSNSTGPQTRIYGAAAADLNNDGYLDLATVNEVSADVRVFLNRADGSGLFGSMLTPQAIGVEASPNAPADFNNDGFMDLCVAAADSEEVSILLGAGDGTFSSIVNISIGGGTEPHGIAPLDVDGDGDLDVVNANVGSNNLALLVNDGSGTFSGPSFFEGGVNGEYGLAAADMNADGITDLVVAGRNGEEIATMLGNGNGTFTAAGPAQSTGGATWVVVLGDVNGDGDLDAATANDGSGTVGILLGQGDGTYAPVSIINIGSHVPAVDLGDLDGDGDLDLVVSSFGGGFWQWYQNDGSGAFSFVDQIAAPDSPSCAVLFDSDNDGDLDLTLTDELADLSSLPNVILMRNGGSSSCSPAPANCRGSIEAHKSRLLLKNASPDEAALVWKWTKGEATPKIDFGNPVGTDSYALCLYEDGVLVRDFAAPSGPSHWKETGHGYLYRDPSLTLDGLSKVKVSEGLVDGEAKAKVKGAGSNLNLPELTQLTGVLDVQLQRTDGSVCWGASFSPPFLKQDGAMLKALSDAPGTTPPAPIWSVIHSQVIAPICAGCHGGSGGLSGLNDCNTGHANLIDVGSTELLTMDRVEPGDPTMSWLMHKLDGTHGAFTAQCVGMFCGSQMPLGGPFLAVDVRDAIRTWITNGALNDCP